VKYAVVAIVPFIAALSLQAQATKSVWDGVYTQAQADRGKTAYSDQCASCHGADLTGGDMAPPLAGAEFMQGWDGLTVGDLFERVRVSMPQNAPGSLTPQQNADILSFVLASNKFPTGASELVGEAATLKQIKFEAKKSPAR
jgi:S-disulfanyl-L-cysteine oxidoreductase SoxD